MTQQTQLTPEPHGFSTESKPTLDAKEHWRDTVSEQGPRSLPAQELTRKEDMPNLQLLNIDQVCAVLNIGRVNVYDLINRKRLKSIKLGARRLVSTRALNDFINQLEEGHDTPG